MLLFLDLVLKLSREGVRDCLDLGLLWVFKILLLNGGFDFLFSIVLKV